MMHFYKQLNAKLPYATEDELEYLRSLDLRKYYNIVMIGAGPGVMAVAMLEDKTEQPAFTIIDYNLNHNEYARLHLAEAGVTYVNFILSDSALAADEFDDNSIDLLIVDGDHSKEGVLRDVYAWWDKINPGGLLFFHDYLERPGGFTGTEPWGFGGVAEAIAELLAGDLPIRFVNTVGISAVYKKDYK